MQVIVPNLPVTGMRLHLEGKKNNRLAAVFASGATFCLQYVQSSVQMLAENITEFRMLTSSNHGQVRPPPATSGKLPDIHQCTTRPGTEMARI
jgi:hypothetical protein